MVSSCSFTRRFKLKKNQISGSLAEYTGFAVDSGCVLTTIVDGEIVVRRGSNKTGGIVSALTAFDKYLHIDPDFKMYNIFDDTKDVLFQVSWYSNTNVLFEEAHPLHHGS
jgi:hypothetical protein